MRLIFLALLIACLPALLPPAAAQSQWDMNKEACDGYEAEDAKLNRTYKAVLALYAEDELTRESIKVAQRAWIAFRDAEMKALYPRDGNEGSVGPMCHCGLIAHLTAQRTKELEEWLEGTEEGDVCAGNLPVHPSTKE